MSALPPFTPRRLLAVFLAGLYAMGAFAGLLHVAAVEHARCAEHGEVVHLDPPLARADVALLLFDEARLSTSERGQHHGEHDHCALNVPCAQTAFSFTGPRVTTPMEHEAPVLASALVQVPAASAESLYRLAPKQGPPVIA